MTRALALALALCTLAFASAAGARTTARVVLTVTPRDALTDQPVAITVSGLRPRSTVTLTATTRSTPEQKHNLWTSTATFRADGSGTVVVARSPSLAGTYRGTDRMGLFWSMRWKTCVSCEMLPAPVATVRLVASGGGRTLATASFTRRARSAGVTVHATTLAAEGFVGCFYAPPAEAPHPAPGILRLGGSEGGLHCDAVASLLATRGYPTLSLAYFGMPGLPEDLENIPLEYFRPALRWLAQQPGVDPAKLVVLGQSRGGECGFLLADAFPELVHSVVSYVGPSTVLPTFSGNGDEAAWTAEGRPIATGTELPVETVAGPIFLVSGAMDEVWPTAVSADAITRRLREHQRTDYTSLIYQAAGHAVGTAVPNVAIGTWGGGSAAGDAHGRADSWPKLLAFLDRLR